MHVLHMLTGWKGQCAHIMSTATGSEHVNYLESVAVAQSASICGGLL